MILRRGVALRSALLASAAVLAAEICLASGAFAAEPAKVALEWKKTEIDPKFRSEGVAVGDFNKDGKMDICAGSVWYAAPDWKMHVIRDKAAEYDPNGYSDTFCNFALDVNKDGWTDQIVVDFPGKETWWFENPQNAEGPWKRHVITNETNNESIDLLDVDGDGTRDLIMGVEGGKMAYLTQEADPLAPWKKHIVSGEGQPHIQRYYHGIGAADVNGDGKKDMLIPEGWWEAPAEASDKPWAWHPSKLGGPCANMYTYDYDGDGDLDVVSSSAHNIGIWWHEQTPDGFKQHEIDSSFSQTHALIQTDMNGDGLPDLVTGKRWWAHGPKGDAQPDAPAVLNWFEFSRVDGKPTWTKHQIDHNSGVGTQFEVADINGDNLLDIAVSNKKGVFVFHQSRKAAE
ncbi:MAG TPA: VCBS repeat-containing protein [Pirellulales bacterium]